MKDIEIPVHILEQAKKSVSKEIKNVEIYTSDKTLNDALIKGWPQNLNALGDRYFVKFGLEKQVDKLLEETIELAHAIKQCQKYGDVNTQRFRAVLAECFDVLFLIEHQIFRFTDNNLLEKIYSEKIEQLKKGLENE